MLKTSCRTACSARFAIFNSSITTAPSVAGWHESLSMKQSTCSARGAGDHSFPSGACRVTTRGTCSTGCRVQDLIRNKPWRKGVHLGSHQGGGSAERAVAVCGYPLRHSGILDGGGRSSALRDERYGSKQTVSCTQTVGSRNAVRPMCQLLELAPESDRRNERDVIHWHSLSPHLMRRFRLGKAPSGSLGAIVFLFHGVFPNVCLLHAPMD